MINEHHSPDCNGHCGGTYVCPGCERTCGYCFPMCDDMSEMCGDCWADVTEARIEYAHDRTGI